MSSVGLALITKDEEENLPSLLASIHNAFDQVVLVDTGSKDKTVEVFKHWAAEELHRNPDFRHTVETFKWVDDFAAARNYADSLIDCDWTVWADADDYLRGAQNLRRLAADAPADLQAYICNYDYAQDDNGNCTCLLKRERLVRTGSTHWEGRVHEAQPIRGRAQNVGPEIVEWVHQKPPQDGIPERNLKILKKWDRDEPGNSRVVGYIGTELVFRGKFKESLPYFRKYLKLTEHDSWDEERAQIFRKMCMALIALDRYEDATGYALQAMQLLPNWPDSYLTLAECNYQTGNHPRAIDWAQEVLRRGVPNTLLIIAPLDYTMAPKLILAGSYGALGDVEKACEYAEDILERMPRHPIASHYRDWQKTRKRETTAKSFISNAHLLVQHDEQLKALKLLEAVPHYAQDHPQVVGMRSALKERIIPLFDPAGFRKPELQGPEPQVFLTDEQAIEFCERLPRAKMLLEAVKGL